MNKLRVGVIGTGNMGINHVRNYSEEIGYFDFIGVYDNDKERSKKVAEKYRVNSFENMEELLDAVDAVSVVVPSYLHKDIGIQVANHRVHALIEKPLALNSIDAMEINEAFQENNVILQVGHIERFNPVIVELEKLINREKIFFMEIHRYSPFSGSGRITDTSVVEDLMIHDVDIACHLLKSCEIEDIRASGEIISSDKTDFASALLTFSNNVHVIINSSRVSQEKERSITINSKNKNIYADLLARSLSITEGADLKSDIDENSTYRINGVVQKVFVPIKEPLKQELLAFYYNVMSRGKNNLVSGLDGIHAVEICEKIAGRIKNA